MSKGDVLDLVATLSNGMADPVSVERYYDDVLYELARENWFVDASVIALARGQREVDLDAAVAPPVVNELGLIYDDTELEPVMLRQMEAFDPYWRDNTGYPRSYVVEDESAKFVALHPAPDVDSNPNLGSWGEPLGNDYPTRNLVFFYSYAPLYPATVFYYLELVIALRVIALDFARESLYTDLEFAQAAKALSEFCKGFLV